MAGLRRLAMPLAGAALLAAVAPATAAAVTVGTGPRGTVAMRFDGRVQEAGRFFTFYGHLTAVRGWSNATTFAGAPTPARARLTFVAVTVLTKRSTVGLRRFSVESRGPLRIFLQTVPETIASDPTTFLSGAPVAVADARLRALVVPVRSRGGAVRTSITGTLRLVSSKPFTINGVPYTLGARGLRVRVAASGTGNVSDIYLPAAELRIAGSATIR